MSATAKLLLPRACEESSNTPANSAGTMTVNLSGSVATLTYHGGGTAACSTFSAAGAVDGVPVGVLIFQKTAGPNLWMEVMGVYHSGANSLTFTVDNIYNGSSGPGAFVTFTSTVVAESGWYTADALRAFRATRNQLDGGLLTILNTTDVQVSDMYVTINGTPYFVAAATYTNNTAGFKDISGSTVNLTTATAALAYVFVYAASLAATIRFEPADGTGDGQTPVYSIDHNYRQAATTGANARRMGAFTYTSAGFRKMYTLDEGGNLRYFCYIEEQVGGVVSVSGSQAAFVAVPAAAAGYMPQDAEAWILSVRPFTSANSALPHAFLSLDGGTTTWRDVFVLAFNSSSNCGELKVPAKSGTLHYKNSGTGASTTITPHGFTMKV